MVQEQELVDVLLDWSTTFIRHSLQDFHQYTRAAGLSLVQMTVLMHLYYQGSKEVTNFSEMLQVTPAAASQMIERMVQQGLVRRAEIPGDRRVRLVSLTEPGRRLVEESIRARQGWIDQLVAAIPAEERAALFSALRGLNRQAQELEIHPA